MCRKKEKDNSELLSKVRITWDCIFGNSYLYFKKHQNKIDKKYDFYLKTAEKFPYNTKVNKKLAHLEMGNQQWHKASEYWEFLYINNKLKNIEDIKNYVICLQNSNQTKKAFNICETLEPVMPEDDFIIYTLSNMYKDKNKSPEAIIYFEKYIKLHKEELEFDYAVSFLPCYIAEKDRKGGEELLQILKALNPEKKKMIKELHIRLYVEMHQWLFAIEYLRTLQVEDREFEFENLILLAMLYNIVGEYTKGQEVFKLTCGNFSDMIIEDIKGYRKIIVFDNGDSRIEYYKTFKNTSKLMITFDSINMEWQNPSFAFKLLMKQDVDIVAIRKREKKTYQQDLQQDDFYSIVEPIAKGYTDRMAYGFSLGAYNTLYFASLLNCRILSIAPRLSIHPKFGRKKIIKKHEMKQNIKMPYNDEIEPLIVYDPKNNIDNRYINEGILPFFPNAQLIKIPYGGHGMAPHLLKMGQLKEFVVSFVNNQTPKYNRKLKVKSEIYFRNLAAQCVKHNKARWAMSLINKSLEMDSNNLRAIKIKLSVYKMTKQFDQGIQFANKMIGEFPKVLDLRLYLIDFETENKNYNQAIKIVNKAIALFGKNKRIMDRKKSIEDKLNSDKAQ